MPLQRQRCCIPCYPPALINDTDPAEVSHHCFIRFKFIKITVNAAADSAYKSLENSGSQLNSLEQILLGTSKIALTANQTLGDTGTIISGMSDKIQLILTSLNNITDSSAYQTLSQLLHADAASYAEFIATPVEVEQIDVYPAVNYGTAVTPFTQHWRCGSAVSYSWH